MILWWIGVIVFALVIVPVVVLILQRLLRPALQIREYANSIDADVAKFPGHVAATVSELATTQGLVATARPQIERYAQALERLR
ncbi:MAG TPA: hypothetical protein VG294_02135 [Solirubrobacteraceae bacterium]|jgi:hypothetical protein|nr:hypothetical protein [Solirubrobacteraceae bacterium]